MLTLGAALHSRRPTMLDKLFADWWLGRVLPFKDVAADKLSAEHGAVLPAVDELVAVLAKNRIVHRVSTWGNQLALRVHLAWRWGELVITQSHEDAVTFEHHIITEGEKRG